MDDLQDCFQQAFTCHQAGQLATAEPLYRKVMQAYPGHPDVLYLLGTLYFQCGRYEIASYTLRQAVTVRPDDAQAHNNLGSALHNQGQFAAAAASFETALVLNPNYAEAHYNLGVTQQAAGQIEAAAAHFEQAVMLNPDYVEAHNNLGVIRQAQGRPEDALACYRQAVARNPSYTEAQKNLFQSLRTLGVSRYERGMLTAAATSFTQALDLAPDDAESHLYLGCVRFQQDRLAAAIACYERALVLKPGLAEAHYNLGVVLQAQEKIEMAVAHYEQAIALKPGYVKAHSNLGAAFKRLGKTDDAVASFTRVLELEPDHAEAHWNRALLWLTQGNLAQGWAEYEWRFQVPEVSPRAFPQPRWDGTSLEDRTILVYAEQGIGDEVLFASCLPDLIAGGGQCVLECDPRLVPLFARSFPTAIVYGRPSSALPPPPDLPPIEVQIPIGSLPLHLRSTLASFPAHTGYLRPDAPQRDEWTERLAALGPGLKIGIAWRSRVARRHDPYYTRIEDWGPVLTTPGVHFINLQYDEAEAELAAAMQKWDVTIHAFDNLDLFHDLDGMAALISALDLIIAPETIVRILAGSLGQPVWKLTSFEGSWPSLGTDASPWFPSLRVFRQPRPGDWAAVLTQVTQALRQRTRTVT